MTIAKDFASKFAVAFVAVAMLFTLVAPAVNAAETAEDLQKTIADLLAQVAELEGKTADEADDSSSASCEAIAAPLTMGSTGANVTALQNRLIADGEAIAAGATGYFGAQTKMALASWQTKNSVSPAVGYYGPLTAAAMSASCDEDATDEDEDDSDDSSDELQGEGSLDVFEIDNASDTDVEEGSEDMEIAEITVEATDGDIEISRMDIVLDANNANTEQDPWEVFETISVWVDGDMIGEVTADDEDEYLDEDDGSLRFSDLDLVLMEDEEVEIVLAATVQSDVDGAGTAADWTVKVEEVRYFDADGVSEDDSSTDELNSGTAAFEIVIEGDGEELTFALGENNPEATDIVVDTDDTTDGVTVLEYTIEAEEGDIEINELWVRLETGTANVSAVVDDVMLVIDGEEFDAEATTTAGTSDDFAFDIDGDVVIDADEEVTVEVVVDFKSTDDGVAYANSGETIKASVTPVLADATDAEGADDILAGAISGSAVGDIHTLVSEGILVPVDGVETATDTQGENDTTGIFTIDFEVTAVEGDYYIAELADSNESNVGGGVNFNVDTTAGAPTTATGVLSSTADEDTTGVFTVREGETETFTLTVTVDASATGQHRVVLDAIYFTENVNGTASLQTYVPTPAQDYRTAYANINGV